VDNTAAAVNKSNGAYYTVLEFDKGSDKLSDKSKQELQEFVRRTDVAGKRVEDIKVMAWPDHEYPGNAVKLSKDDVNLADDRTEAIEHYLKKDLNASVDVSTFNMAKRPNKISEFVRSDDYKTKKVFEKTGAMPTGSGGDLASLVNSKASKALIMVEFE
jgi:hypothetical protein